MARASATRLEVKKIASIGSMPLSPTSQTAGASRAGRTARKIPTIHHRMTGTSLFINGLVSNAKSFNSSGCRPYTPPVQSVVPINGSPFGELR